MKIGIDFDNTIVNYSGVFHRTGADLGWFGDDDVGETKSDVKNYFVSNGNEDRWTELQGIVYGKTISMAKPYEGLISCLLRWVDMGHELCVVSHKTKYPIIGDKLDFHDAAIQWMSGHLFEPFEALSNLSRCVHFNPTIAAKVQKVAELDCDVFIDDLEKIFLHPDFPLKTQKLLFSPDSNVVERQDDIFVSKHWNDIQAMERLFVK